MTFLATILLCAGAQVTPVREHVLYDSIPLNGAWEMAYQPYAWESREMPVFRGVTVERGVSGYWEDMVGDLAQP